MSDPRADQVHIADAAAVVLEGRNPFRVWRPQQDWAVALGPAGVVGRVREVLHAIGRDLDFLLRRYVPHPEVEVAHERRAFAVRGEDVIAPLSASCTAATSTATTSLRRARLARRQVAEDFGAGGRIHQEGFGSLFRGHAIPEAPVLEPGRPHT